MQRIFRLLLVLSAIVLGGFYFVHWSRMRALNSGAVHFRNPPAENAKTAAPPPAAPQPDQPEVASNSGEPSRPGSPAPPSSDSLPRQPRNGIVAAGSGKFELYRQGDLTFRLNTETGDACVLLATQAEWSKNIVYSHGCGGQR